MNKTTRLFHTVRYLKATQVVYQILNRVKPKKHFNTYLPKHPLQTRQLLFTTPVFVPQTRVAPLTYRFLNIEHTFQNEIDWSIDTYGKLWNYNLQYLNTLHQEDMEPEEKLDLLKSIYKALQNNTLALEPYPVSLRIIHIIRFIHKYDLHKEEWLLKNLYAELTYLFKNFEYHLLGNHLLENAFALLMGGVYFQNQKWVNKAEKTLLAQLKEQITKDGAHFELSPMYHSIIFYRVLELLDWYRHNTHKNQSLYLQIQKTAEAMRSWLEHIKFDNGDIPHFNDSSNGITFTANKLLHIAEQLNVKAKSIPLSDSGYRSLQNSKFEIKIDVAKLAVDYQPGHAHADSLSFWVYYKGKPLIVEQGTSTYQINDRRALERSSQAHNTVTINRENHSDVWSGFRVGSRAQSNILVDEQYVVKAQHNGYAKKHKTLHTRTYTLGKDFQIIDTMSVKSNYEAFLHFAPGLIPSRENDTISFKDTNVIVFFEQAENIILEKYKFAECFNKYSEAWRAIISFQSDLKTVFRSK